MKGDLFSMHVTALKMCSTWGMNADYLHQSIHSRSQGLYFPFDSLCKSWELISRFLLNAHKAMMSRTKGLQNATRPDGDGDFFFHFSLPFWCRRYGVNNFWPVLKSILTTLVLKIRSLDRNVISNCMAKAAVITDPRIHLAFFKHRAGKRGCVMLTPLNIHKLDVTGQVCHANENGEWRRSAPPR